MKNLKLKKGDIIIAVCVLVAAALIFCAVYFLSPEGNTVKIEVDSKTLASFPLDENRTYNIEKNGKTTNTVVIKDKKVSVSSADCPDKICVKHKEISKSGESIICLPNRVVVSIENEETEVDGVAR
ncbi:MAG: NusG domain II-containing protein [Ruminococcaceae bacterium]|nr:NusG domain II-containing protein [Oscillospiraceae bacterium]